MSYEQEAIGQLFSLTVGGTMFAVQLTTALTKELYHFFKKAVQEGVGPVAKHRLTMNEFLKRSNGVEIFNIKESDFKVFQAAAKKSPMLYYAGCLDKSSSKGERLITVCVSPADVPIVNQIIELNHLDASVVGSAKVSAADMGQEIPPLPDMDETLEEEEGSWWDFVGPEGEYGTPEENKAKREAADHAVPTQPVSGTENASPSATSSGSSRGKENEKPSVEASQQGIPQTTASPSAEIGAISGAESVIMGDGFVVYPDIAIIQAVKFATDHGKVSAELLQQELGISQNRAMELIDKMEELGVINPQKEVVMSYDDFLDSEINKLHKMNLPTQEAGKNAEPLDIEAIPVEIPNAAASKEGRKPIREQLDEVKAIREAKRPLNVDAVPMPQAVPTPIQ